jgi:hypothetical protein
MFAATATCPTGTHAIGGGGDSTDLNPGDAVLQNSEPSGGSPTTAATGWTVNYGVMASLNGYPGAGGNITAFVVCAP